MFGSQHNCADSDSCSPAHGCRTQDGRHDQVSRLRWSNLPDDSALPPSTDWTAAGAGLRGYVVAALAALGVPAQTGSSRNDALAALCDPYLGASGPATIVMRAGERSAVQGACDRWRSGRRCGCSSRTARHVRGGASAIAPPFDLDPGRRAAHCPPMPPRLPPGESAFQRAITGQRRCCRDAVGAAGQAGRPSCLGAWPSPALLQRCGPAVMGHRGSHRFGESRAVVAASARCRPAGQSPACGYASRPAGRSSQSNHHYLPSIATLRQPSHEPFPETRSAQAWPGVQRLRGTCNSTPTSSTIDRDSAWAANAQHKLVHRVPCGRQMRAGLPAFHCRRAAPRR